jgi:hypothetical protein
MHQMERMRRAALFLFLVLAGCGEAVKDDHFQRQPEQPEAAPVPVRTDAVPVRVGELGPSFNACQHAGTTRNVAAEGVLAVRAAPFDTAQETGGVRADSRFFICTRSHDQRWFGIVYALEGDPAVCGVGTPVPARRAYTGPCESGWVPSAFVRLVAG